MISAREVRPIYMNSDEHLQHSAKQWRQFRWIKLPLETEYRKCWKQGQPSPRQIHDAKCSNLSYRNYTIRAFFTECDSQAQAKSSSPLTENNFIWFTKEICGIYEDTKSKSMTLRNSMNNVTPKRLPRELTIFPQKLINLDHQKKELKTSVNSSSKNASCNIRSAHSPH